MRFTVKQIRDEIEAGTLPGQDVSFEMCAEIEKLKSLLARCQRPVFEAHYEDLHAEILEALGK